MKVGIIGAGHMARRHFESYLDLDDVEVVAVAGETDRNRGVFVEGGEARAFYTDHRDLLARGDVSAVSVATPTHTHAEIVKDCFQAGCHVLCEKPISQTLPQAHEMVAAAHRADRIFMMGFSMRFFAEFQAVKQLIDAGEVGEVKNVWLRRCRRLPEQAWYSDPKKSGGVTFELGIHLIDLARWLVASPIQWVTAVMHGDVYRLGKDDNSWMLLEFANGAIGSIGASYSYSIAPNDFGIVGTKKSLAVDGEKVIEEDYRAGRSGVRGSDADALSFGDPLRMELDHFVECIRSGSEPLADGEDGVASLAVALAAVESAKSGKRIAVERAPTGSLRASLAAMEAEGDGSK